MNKSVLSLSHNDLDGVSVQIVLGYIFNVKSFGCNYSETLEYMKNIKKLIHEYSRVIISDLTMDKDSMDYYIILCNTFPNIKFYWVDHHYKSTEFLDLLNNMKLKNSTILYNGLKSSTKIIAQYFKQSSEYIEAVNAFDIWDTKSKHFDLGMKYNTLFWEFKSKSYFSQFKRDTTLLEVHNKQYNKILVNKDNYFKDLETKGLVLKNNNTVVIFGDNYQNWTQLYYKEFAFNIQVFSFGKILIKISENIHEDMCITLIENIMDSIDDELLLNAGGHHHILSLTHSGDNDYNIIIDYTKKIFNILSKY